MMTINFENYKETTLREFKSYIDDLLVDDLISPDDIFEVMKTSICELHTYHEQQSIRAARLHELFTSKSIEETLISKVEEKRWSDFPLIPEDEEEKPLDNALKWFNLYLKEVVDGRLADKYRNVEFDL